MNPEHIQSSTVMESDYEAQLADYSLQDSPFYEANTPVFFNLSFSSAAEHSENRTSNMIGALNLASKRALSPIASSTSLPSGKMRLPTTAGANGDRGNASFKQLIDGDIDTRKQFNITSNLCSTESINGATNIGAPSKKKRKCVTFLPNYVQVKYLLHKD